MKFDSQNVELGEVCEQRIELVLPSNGVSLPFVGLEHIMPGNIKVSNVGTSQDVKSMKFKFYPNDILYGKLRPYLDKAVIVDFEGLSSTDLIVINAIREKILPQYLILILHSDNFLIHAKSTTSGTNHPRTSWKNIRTFKFWLPEKKEQEKISDILLIIDDGIQKSDDISRHIEQIKSELMESLLTRGIGHKDFKEVEIGTIPEDWIFCRLIELAKTTDDPVQTGPFGLQLHASDYTEGGIPLILIKNVINGQILDDDIPHISKNKAESLSRYRLKIGDIIFSRVGSVGRAAVIRPHQEGWMLSGQMLRVRLENPEIINDFLAYVIASKWFQNALASRTVGATRKSINTKILSNLPMILPSMPEQRKIVDILSAFDKKLELEKMRKEKLKKIRKSLMNNLLTGKIRVKVAS